MLFPTFSFAVFLLIVMPLSWLTMPNIGRWRLVMIGANYVFYAWWNPAYVFLLAGSTLINQVLAQALYRSRSKRRRKGFLIAAVVANVGILTYFKYWDFFASSAQNALSSIGLHVSMPLLTAVLPVGLSFYTFMALSYVIDTYRGELVPVSLSRFAVFLSFFPHLVAGPIVRPQGAPTPDGAWAARLPCWAGWGMASPAITLPLLGAIAVGLGGQVINPRAWCVVVVRLSTAPILAQGLALGAVLMVINTISPRGIAPLIYFRF